MRVVLLDTSLMLDCAKMKLDIFAGLDGLMEGAYEVRVSEGVITELRAKAAQKSKAAGDAKAALAILGAGKVVVETAGFNVDGWLLARGKELGAVVGTNDAALRARLRKAGVKVVSIRGGSRLDFV
ncbi:Uncharacterised protein [Candidatus Burarchaeum australiense]|nr:Uncharacterised protein [Candidatus Burarchaeum australiense]